MLFLCQPEALHKQVFSFSWGHFSSQEKLKKMLLQNFGVTRKSIMAFYSIFLSVQLEHSYSYIFQGHIKQDSIPGLQVFFLRNKEEAYQ